MGLFKKSIQQMYESGDVTGLIKALDSSGGMSAVARAHDAMAALQALGPRAVDPLMDLWDEFLDERHMWRRSRSVQVLVHIAMSSDEEMQFVLDAQATYLTQRCPNADGCFAALNLYEQLEKAGARVWPSPELKKFVKERFNMDDFGFKVATGSL